MKQPEGQAALPENPVVVVQGRRVPYAVWAAAFHAAALDAVAERVKGITKPTQLVRAIMACKTPQQAAEVRQRAMAKIASLPDSALADARQDGTIVAIFS